MEGILENRFWADYHKIVSPTKFQKVKKLLDKLKSYHPRTYVHSLSVALLSPRISSFFSLNQNPSYDGCLHDIGKIFVPRNILDWDNGAMPEEMKEIVNIHPRKGYELFMNEGLPWMAFIALRHHIDQVENPHPKITENDSPFRNHLYNPEMAMEYLANISIADKSDAYTRKNGKYGKAPLTKEQKLEKLLANLPHRSGMIQQLYNANIILN